MLWKKEGDTPDAMYVDLIGLHGGTAMFETICNQIQLTQINPTSTWNKCDGVASYARTEGNKYVTQGKWTAAIVCYNESLCYAENGSKNVSLAYANRATCFLKMKMYNECLVDIELAKEAGYPAELMPKLDQRQEACLNAIGEGTSCAKIEPKLSIAADEQFPCMSNVVEFGHDTFGDLALFAKEDIDVGETIVVEKSFISYVYSHYGSKCNICLKADANLMSCNKCTVAMFCNDECCENSFHEHECGLRFCEKNQMNGAIMRLVRACLVAIDMFSDAEELISFVEEAVSSDQKQIPVNLTDPKSKYAALLKMPKNRYEWSHPNVFLAKLSTAFCAQKMLMKVPKINAMFNDEKHRRFLMHFIANTHNAIETCTVSARSNFPLVTDDDCTDLQSQTGLMTGYVKHSCAPNVFVSFVHDARIIITTIRPIKIGEQLTQANLRQLLTEPKSERDQTLWQSLKMTCKCVRCEVGDASAELRIKIRSDPDFQYILNQPMASAQGNNETKQMMIDTCKRFLRKYGQDLWSIELGTVIRAYISHIIKK